MAEPQGRLACFDAAAASLRDGLQTGDVSLSRYRRIALPVRASVATATETSSGFWRIDLDNGQTWQSEESQATIRPPRPGTRITIEGGVFGGYWLHLPNGHRYRVRITR